MNKALLIVSVVLLSHIHAGQYQVDLIARERVWARHILQKIEQLPDLNPESNNHTEASECARRVVASIQESSLPDVVK